MNSTRLVREVVIEIHIVIITLPIMVVLLSFKHSFINLALWSTNTIFFVYVDIGVNSMHHSIILNLTALNTVITVLFFPILLKRSQYFLVYHYFVPLLRESTPFAGKNATNRLTNVEQFVYWANLTVEISVTLCLFIPATDLMLTKKEGRINWNKKNTIYLPQYIFNIDSVMFPPVCVVYCL